MLMTFLVTSVVTGLCVMIHYGVLRGMTQIFDKWDITNPRHITVMLLGAILGHVIEIWCFAFAYFILLMLGNAGTLQNLTDAVLLDCVYFSFVTYTTLGFGDIVPQGAIRFLVGTEALVGLVLITWTASFFYLQMEKNMKG